jgi:hypothetical protein
MAQANFTAPVALDPRLATYCKVRHFNADTQGGMVRVTIDWYNASNAVIFTDSFELSGAQVVAWIAAQEATILNRYMAAKGLAGTVA